MASKSAQILSATGSNVGETVQVGRAAIRVVADNEVIFLYRLPMFSIQLHTMFPLKCSLRWAGGDATFTARAPVGPMVFLVAFMTAWEVGLLIALTSGEIISPVMLAPFMILPLIAYTLLYLLPLVAEKRRARWALSAVEKRLETWQ